MLSAADHACDPAKDWAAKMTQQRTDQEIRVPSEAATHAYAISRKALAMTSRDKVRDVFDPPREVARVFVRLLPVIFLSALLVLGVIGAGFAIDAPTIVLFVFVGCLGLFIAALTAGALHLREY
jgi:hypothetical protein